MLLSAEPVARNRPLGSYSSVMTASCAPREATRRVRHSRVVGSPVHPEVRGRAAARTAWPSRSMMGALRLEVRRSFCAAASAAVAGSGNEIVALSRGARGEGALAAGDGGRTCARMRSVGVSAGTISCRCRFATMALLGSIRRFCGSPLMLGRGRCHSLMAICCSSAFPHSCVAVRGRIPHLRDCYTSQVPGALECRAAGGWRPWDAKGAGPPNRRRAPACPRALCPSARRRWKLALPPPRRRRARATRKVVASTTTSMKSCSPAETLRALKTRARKVRLRGRSAGSTCMVPPVSPAFPPRNRETASRKSRKKVRPFPCAAGPRLRLTARILRAEKAQGWLKVAAADEAPI